MPAIFKIVPQVTTPIALAALVVACILWLIDRALKKRGKTSDKTHRLLLLALFGFIFLGVVALVGDLVLRYEGALNSLYRIRVTVIGANQMPIENATVWTSIGGEPKKVASGWEFDIPRENKPLNSEIIVYASVDNSSLRGKVTVRLDTDHNPSVAVTLEPDESALVRGIVEDESGRAINGVEVSVVGYGNEHVTTSANGTFVLRAHVVDGQTVRLHAEAQNYLPLDQDQPAGALPAMLILHAKHGNPY